MIIKSNQDEIQNYLSDASNTKGFCDAVYFPENADEISDILKKANSNKIQVTVAGNRTGLTGACVPFGGIVISTEKLNKIIEINKVEDYAIVEAGVLLSEFQQKVNDESLFYPPDPTETNCFIGGTVSTNASGAQTFKYDATRNYVLGLDIILPTGEILSISLTKIFGDGLNLILKSDNGNIYELSLPDYVMPETKNASGYFCKKNMDAVDLFIGSEGTLGIITQIKLKLLKKPFDIISSVLFFDSEEKAFRFLHSAKEKSYRSRKDKLDDEIDALALEFFDENALTFLRNEYTRIPRDSKAAIWFEQEANEANENRLVDLWIDLFTSSGGNESDAWFALTAKEKNEIKDFRHKISAKVNEFIALNNFRKLGTDTAVPGDNFESYYHQTKKMVELAGLDYVIYGHFGNSHIHLNMLPKNENEFELGKKIYREICSLAIKLGGTFSAEHGVGKNKTDLLFEMYGNENVKKMIELKNKLDPNMILGKGNIFNT